MTCTLIFCDSWRYRREHSLFHWAPSLAQLNLCLCNPSCLFNTCSIRDGRWVALEEGQVPPEFMEYQLQQGQNWRKCSIPLLFFIFYIEYYFRNNTFLQPLISRRVGSWTWLLANGFLTLFFKAPVCCIFLVSTQLLFKKSILFSLIFSI